MNWIKALFKQKREPIIFQHKDDLQDITLYINYPLTKQQKAHNKMVMSKYGGRLTNLAAISLFLRLVKLYNYNSSGSFITRFDIILSLRHIREGNPFITILTRYRDLDVTTNRDFYNMRYKHAVATYKLAKHWQDILSC